MKLFAIKDLMVPISEYATVHDDATLHEAVISLHKAQQEYDASKTQHRAILVCDKANKVIGKINHMDIIKSLEPKYDSIEGTHPFSQFGFSKTFLNSLINQHLLWDEPFNDICRKGRSLKVKDIMYKITMGEFVKLDSTLNEAVHLFILGRHQGLLVKDGKNIVGILRLTDVYDEIASMMMECNTEN